MHEPLLTKCFSSNGCVSDLSPLQLRWEKPMTSIYWYYSMNSTALDTNDLLYCDL